MDELRESSLLFSIEGLLETERERVQREAREAERRREDELQRIAEAAERRRLASEREREARGRRESLERERERLEDERREAMTRATVERARVEAEARVRLVEADEQRKHELLLARLQAEGRTARYKAIAWLSSGASFVVLSSVVAGYLGYVRPAQAARAQRYESLVAESRVREQAGQQALQRERAKVEALDERVRFLESRPAAAAAAPPSGVKPQPPQTPANTRPKKRPCGDSGDPLDDCLR
ncbi:MAG: hypothetical protein EOO73_27025 [Myxococcales bacterium]|nr:MAG: hypothetical protein EOO73_27025 [Myxococcales bacterium]